MFEGLDVELHRTTQDVAQFELRHLNYTEAVISLLDSSFIVSLLFFALVDSGLPFYLLFGGSCSCYYSLGLFPSPKR